jgi:hypothetical protein
MLKMIFVIYIGFAFLLAVLGIFKADETDKNGYYKTNWLFITGLLLIVIAPIFAKLCGLV